LIIAALTIVPAVAFVIAPEVINPRWPWTLTPLTGRTVGAWLAAIGSTTAVMYFENDFVRLQLTAAAVWLFGALQLLAMVRFASTVNWNNPVAWILVVLWLAMGVLGFYLWLGAQRRSVKVLSLVQ
jgi:hypothetical protein